MVTLVANGAKSRSRAARPATVESRVSAQETFAPVWDEFALAERLGHDAVRYGVLAHAADFFAGAALQRAWPRADAEALFERVALLTGASPEQARVGVYSRAARDPRLLTLSPGQAIKAQLGLLYAAAPVSEVSLWARRAGPVHCLFSTSSVAPSRHARLRVSEALQNRPKRTGTPRSIHVLPVSRTTESEAALAVRFEPGRSSRALELAAEAIPALAWILERGPALESSEEAQRALAESLERETRIACDLHDGSLQDVAALASDLHYFRQQLEQALPVNGDRRLLGRVDDIEARIRQIDAGLRAVAQSGSLPASARGSFTEAVQEIADDCRTMSGICVELELDEVSDLLAEGDRILAVRVVEEALRNVAQHSGADEASVRVSATRGELTVEVADNGRGFDVEKVRRRAIRNGRLGLRSMEQRARLLGGTLELSSSRAGTTKVTLTLGVPQPGGRDAEGEWSKGMDRAAVTLG